MSGRFYFDPLQYSIEEAYKLVNYISIQNLLLPNLRRKFLLLLGLLRIWRCRGAPQAGLRSQNTGLAPRIGSDSNRPFPRAFGATTPRSFRQFVEQRLRIFQIERVEAFSEPAVDRSQ